MENAVFLLTFLIALEILLGCLYEDLVSLFHFSVYLNVSIVSVSNSVRGSYIRILPWSTLQTILFTPSSPYLNLFPGLDDKDPSVSLNLLVRLSIKKLPCLWWEIFPVALFSLSRAFRVAVTSFRIHCCNYCIS